MIWEHFDFQGVASYPIPKVLIGLLHFVGARRGYKWCEIVAPKKNVSGCWRVGMRIVGIDADD